MEEDYYPMEDELTESMHSEFTIDAGTEIAHRCYCVLGCVKDGAELSEMMRLYNVTEQDINKNIARFKELTDPD